MTETAAAKKSGMRMNLLARIVVLVIGTLILFAIVVSAVEVTYFRGILHRGLVGRGRAISTTLASALVEMPDSAIGGTIAAVKRDAGLAYVEVVSQTGTVTAHTFEDKLPRQDPKVLLETQEATETVVDGREVLDVPASVITGAIVHVGLDLADSAATLREAQLRLWAATLFSLLGAAVISLYFGTKIVRPLRSLTAAARRIVEGDLTANIAEGGDDEVGELSTAFAQMVTRLKQVLSALQDSVKLLTEAGRDLGIQANEQSQTITRQATALQETQVTAQEIKQTSLLASQKAEAVLKLTEKADQVSGSGEAAVERSLAGLTDIRAQVDEIAQRIGQLAERTQQIGSITQTVKDLADQSNMLALNAAIEAVRSGEHGKGFAVVAREIRSLADQSIQATTRVREILEDIGGAIRAAVVISEKGAQKIEGGLFQVKATGENLRELSGIVRENSSAVRQIAAAVSQQNAGITQIFSAVTDQTRMMDETMQRLETTTQAAAVLKGLSERVSEVLGGFKI